MLDTYADTHICMLVSSTCTNAAHHVPYRNICTARHEEAIIIEGVVLKWCGRNESGACAFDLDFDAQRS
jgi:hypothetical protein